MKVTLLNYTTDARETLLMTKQTRLSTTVEAALEDIKGWPEDKKQAELDYMLKTIQSSWEFVDYIFLIEGVSRAFTHQFVRTRTGSYAQQSQRTVIMNGFDYITPKNLPEDAAGDYKNTMGYLRREYNSMLNNDVPPQDARGILPTNVETSIIGKFSLRTLSEMAKKRLCPRTQGEYQDVFKEMRRKVIEVHPYFEKFLRVYCAAVGVCQFPNFKECPIKGGLFNPETGRRWDDKVVDKCDDCNNGYNKPSIIPKFPVNLEEQQRLWEQMDFEATPKWKGNS